MRNKCQRVMAFGAHPDDVEFQCAGVLALLARHGYEIHIAVMAGGEYGSTTLSPAEIRGVRLNENADSAAVIGAKFHYAGGHDGEIDYSAEYRKLTLRMIREVRPDVVFTCPPQDYIVDHEETSRLVRNACFLAPVPNCDLESGLAPTSDVPYLYYWSAMGQTDIYGRPLPIACAVDISLVLEIKEHMLASHKSQREWLKNHHNMDQYIDDMRQNAFRAGKIIGCSAAEGFTQHRGHGYPADNVLARILGNLCVELDEGTTAPGFASAIL